MKTAYLVASGDLRLSANQVCWPAQAAMEEILTRALKAEGWAVRRAHPFDKVKQHGFPSRSQSGALGTHIALGKLRFAGRDGQALRARTTTHHAVELPR